MKRARAQIIQYWHADQPPEQIVELMATVRLRNPDCRHVLFSQATADELIARHFSQRETAAFRALTHPTSQADYLRYCAAFALGGLCVDADVRCTGSVRPLLEGPRRGIVFGQRTPPMQRFRDLPPWPYLIGPYETLINGIFAFRRAGDPLLRLALDVATANIENRIADGAVGIWVTTGPGVLTSFYLLHHLGSFDAFCRYAAGTILEPSFNLFCEVVDDYSRVDSALRGIDMAAVEDLSPIIEHVGISRSHDGTTHWSRPAGSIFR